MPETETERVGLSEAERRSINAALRAPQAVAPDAEMVYAATERILADRHAALLAELAATREALARVEAVVSEWGMDETDSFAETFAEAISDSGAWRFARDLRAALDAPTRSR